MENKASSLHMLRKNKKTSAPPNKKAPSKTTLYPQTLVTRTGIEPMFPAWEASVLTSWPTSQLTSGAPLGIRTPDTLIKSQVLYQLS